MRILQTDGGQERADAHARADFIRTNSHTSQHSNMVVLPRDFASFARSIASSARGVLSGALCVDVDDAGN
jgi:hypothetical protein